MARTMPTSVAPGTSRCTAVSRAGVRSLRAVREAANRPQWGRSEPWPGPTAAHAGGAGALGDAARDRNLGVRAHDAGKPVLDGPSPPRLVDGLDRAKGFVDLPLHWLPRSPVATGTQRTRAGDGSLQVEAEPDRTNRVPPQAANKR